MLEAIMVVFLAHFLADYPLQGFFLAEWKSKSWYILFIHCFIWSGLVAVGLMVCGVYAPWKFVFLLVGHFGIDAWKCRTWKTPEEKQPVLIKWGPKITGMQAFMADQTLHAIQLFVVLFA